MRLKITAGVNTWLIAGESQAQADGNYQGRLLNELKLSQSLTALGSAPVTLNISVRNDDGYISPAIDLWGALVEITADGGTTWSGTITAYDSDGDGITYLVATEKAAPELTIQMPDEVARLVTVDENFHSSAVNVTLPLVFGGNGTKPHLIKGILIDKTQGIYLLCVGEIHQIVKVYRGTEEITTGFSAYTGTAGQADYAGFAYVRLTDEAIRKNDDGSYVEISADVIGLKLGSATIEQCRNGARVLYYLLTTAKDGVGGWGLGIATSEINTTAFNQAISDVDAAGLKFDGIFYFRQAAQSWIDQICLAIRGAYSIGRDGKRALYINKSAASAKTYTENNMRMLRHGVGAYTGRVYNKGKLDFDYNPITGQFMQSAQFEDSTSIAAIGEQEFYGQSYLIKDMVTAQAIVEYTCKKSLIGARKVYFETDELPTAPRNGTVITVTRADLGISGDYQITSLEIGDHVHTIEAEKFDALIFAVGTPGTAIGWTKDPPIVSPVSPGQASGLTLTSKKTRSADGTNVISLLGTFILPDKMGIAASVEYGEGLEPDVWFSYGLIRNNKFEISPLKPASIYSVRVQVLSATGPGEYITASVTTAGDSDAPGIPVISVTGSMQFMQVLISLSEPPDDLAGFAVYRGTDNDPQNAVIVGSVIAKDGLARFVDRVSNYTDVYYYFARAYDEWQNYSDFSAASAPVQAFKILDADILRQLTPADALNTDPYFADFTAWSGDIADSPANPDNFVDIADGPAGSTGFKSIAGEKLIFGVMHSRLIPYDATRHYVLSAFMRASGGIHGLGFAFYNTNKDLISHWSVVTAGIDTSSAWQHFSKTFTSVPPGTVFISPMIICNNDTSEGVVLEVQKARLREVLTADILIANEAIITNAIQILNGIITNAHIDSLDAEKVKTGILDVERLAATVAHIRQLAVLGRNLLSDPSFLEVPKSYANDAITIGGSEEDVFAGTSFDFGGWNIAADVSESLFGVWSNSQLVPVGNGIHLILDLGVANRAYIGQRVKIMPLQHYTFSAYIALLETAAVNLDLVIAWYSGETYLSKSSAQVQGEINELQRVFVTGQAPVGASHAIVYVRLETISGTGYRHAIISAVQLEYGEEPTEWVGREQGTITADRIFAGLLKSLNYEAPAIPGDFAVSGVLHDLLTGAIVSKNLLLDEDGNLKIRGDITGSSGSFTGDITGATGTFTGVLSSGMVKFNSMSLFIESGTEDVYIKVGAYRHGVYDISAKRLTVLRILIGDDLIEVFGACTVAQGGNGWDCAQAKHIIIHSGHGYLVQWLKNESDDNLYVRLHCENGFPVTQTGLITSGTTVKIVESVYSEDIITVAPPAGTLVEDFYTVVPNDWTTGVIDA